MLEVKSTILQDLNKHVYSLLLLRTSAYNYSLIGAVSTEYRLSDSYDDIFLVSNFVNIDNTFDNIDSLIISDKYRISRNSVSQLGFLDNF